VRALGFDPLWFGILFVMNMEMAYLTPPFGFNLFVMRGWPRKISPWEIFYRAVWPFVGLQALGLILVMIWPEIGTWLPARMIR